MITDIEMQKLLAEKQNKIASILGEKEAKRLMERAIKLVLSGKKAIADIIG